MTVWILFLFSVLIEINCFYEHQSMELIAHIYQKLQVKLKNVTRCANDTNPGPMVNILENGQ